MRRFILTLLVGLVAAPAARAAGRLDLPTALNHALDHNRALARSALNLRGGELAVAGAQSAFGLRIQPDGSAGSSQAEDTYQYGLAVGRKFLPGTDVEVGARMTHAEDDSGERSRRSSLRVDLTQPLFRNFGALVQGEDLLRSRLQVRAARRDYEQQKTDLLLDVVESFEGLIRLQRQIASDESAFTRMDKLYRLTQARERQGRATRVDTLRVELRRGQALARLEGSREDYSSKQRDFAELLGYPPDTSFDLEPPPLLDVEVPGPEDALRIALSNRLDYAQALQDREDSARGLRIARRGLRPDLSLNARYERRGDSRFSDNAGYDEDVWSVGLSGDTELNQAAERARMGQAALNLEASRETIRIREMSIAREVQQTITAYRRALGDLKIAERNHRLAQSRARLARRLFELGRGDNFSVTDAEESLTEAGDQVYAARANASISGYRLLRTMGTLVQYPDDLKPPVTRAAL